VKLPAVTDSDIRQNCPAKKIVIAESNDFRNIYDSLRKLVFGAILALDFNRLNLMPYFPIWFPGISVLFSVIPTGQKKQVNRFPGNQLPGCLSVVLRDKKWKMLLTRQ